MSEKISKDDLAALIAEVTGSGKAKGKESLEHVLATIAAA